MAGSSFNWLRRLSIRWQLVIAVALVQTLLMTIFVIGTVEQQREFLFDRTRQRVELECRLLSNMSERFVEMHDDRGMSDIIASLSQDPRLRFVMLTDAGGTILGHTTRSLRGTIASDPRVLAVIRGPATAGVYSETDNRFEGAAPIKSSDNTLIGWAFVGREFSSTNAYLRTVVVAGLLYTSAAAVVATFVAMLLANRLLKPLKLLLAGAQRLAEDQLDEPIRVMSGDEIGGVTGAFNSAMQRLSEQRNALRQEVADRVHAEQELHQIYGLSHRRAAELDAVIESLPQAVYIGTEQQLTKCNARAMSVLRVASLAELGMLHETHVLLSAADRRPLGKSQMPFQLALLGETSVADLILQERGTTAEIYIRVAAAPVLQNGRIVGAVCIAMDVTTQAIEQEKLRKAKAEAEEANRAKDQFLAVLSHELRTPLTPALTLAQMMERDPALPEEARQDIITIRRNVELEAQLIDDLLDLTRISQRKIELKCVRVDVHEKLRHVIGMCEADLVAKSIKLSVELHAEHFVITADATRLQQVFWNLLRNAVKFTRSGDQIAVRTRNATGPSQIDSASPGNPELVIEIRDSGIGIESSVLARVFDAFEQGSREVTRAFGGLGLGLTISKAMVDLHHGRITAYSAGTGQGATFTVELPLQLDAIAGNIMHDFQRLTPLPSAKPRTANSRILLVEDHADTAKATSRLLTQCGYQVRLADSVAQAIRLARAEPFDLIISDIGLPDGTGHDLIRQLVAEAPLSGMAVRGIAMSGFGQVADLQRSQEAGFSEHLVKPVNPAALLHAVDDVLNSKPQ